jgi:hypothetical protein
MAPPIELASRAGLAALGLLLALVTVARSWTLAGEQRALSAWLQESGPVDERLERELAREPDVDGLTVRAVRASLVREMALTAATDAAAPEGRAALRQSASRLEETARRAGAALARRPASWEAAMVLGAATYLSLSQGRDSRLFTTPELWEAPLTAALRLAPTKREPVRFLTAAYLEIWPALSPPKRAAAQSLVTEMLRNPADAGLILGPWLSAGGRAALAALPPDPKVWEQAQSFLAGRGDWEGFSAAREQWDRVLHNQLRAQVAAADGWLAKGDLRTARQLYLDVLERARPDLRYRDLLETALSHCPPGPVGRTTAERLTGLLDWSLERCLAAECTLSAGSLVRLARLVGDAAPPQEATAVLLSGDLPGALSLERRAEGLWSEAWAPYQVVKARALTERQQLAEAAAALDLVPRSWWEQPAYWQARLAMAQAGGDAAGAATAAERLRAMTRQDWAATAWTWHQDRARLEMLTQTAARRLEIDLDGVPAAGGVVELRLDGALLGVFPVQPGGGLRLDHDLRPGDHLLEIETAGGARVFPGAVRLR